MVKCLIAFNDLFRLSEFTHGGKLQVYEEYRDSSLGASQPRIWTKEAVEEHIKQFEVSLRVNFYQHFKLLRVKIPKVQKDTEDLTAFCAFGISSIKSCS